MKKQRKPDILGNWADFVRWVILQNQMDDFDKLHKIGKYREEKA